MKTTLKLPAVTTYQREAIFCADRWSVIEASTKAGKTLGCILWLLHQAGQGRGTRNYWWVAPIFSVADIAYRRMADFLMRADPAKRIWSTNKVDRTITLASGGVIWFKSADKPDGLYGEDVHAAVIDEASRCKEDAWHAVRSTLTATEGRCRIIGNVKGRKNWAAKLGARAKAGMEGWKYAKITALDAVREGVITQAEVDEARRILPDHVFRELYLAEPTEDGANPFGFEHIRACIGELSSEEPVAFGVDLARKVDYTVVIGLDKSGSVCRFERWHGARWESTIERILGIIGDVPTLVDSTGVGDAVAERLQDARPTVEGFVFTGSSKPTLVEGLIVSVQRGELTVPDGPIIEEMEQFEYVTRGSRVTYEAAEGFHDDCVCSLALADKKRRVPAVSCGAEVIQMGSAVEVVHDVAESLRLRNERMAAFLRGE